MHKNEAHIEVSRQFAKKPVALLVRCFSDVCYESTPENNKDVNNHIFCDIPIGILFIYSYVKKHLSWVDPQVIDAEALMFENAYKGMEANWSLLIEKVVEAKPDIIGLSMTYYKGAALFHETCERIKAVLPDVTIVGGGNYPTDGIDVCLEDPNVDYVIQSEGEKTFTQFVERKLLNQDLTTIDGICYRNENGELVINKKKEYIPDISVLPTPDHSVVPMHLYGRGRNVMERAEQGCRFLTMIASRGCPYQCSFCSNKIFWGRSIKYRSAESILDEIAELKYKYGASVIGFNDDNFLLNRKISGEVMKGIIKRKLDVKWMANGGSNVRALMFPGFLELAVESGLCFLNLAIESGTDEILKAVRKPLRVSEAIDVVGMCREKFPRLYLLSNFVIGFPFETREQIETTFNFSASLNLDWCVYPMFTPYPKTELYDYCVEKGLIEKFNFSAYKTTWKTVSHVNGVDWDVAWLEDYTYEKNLKINFIESYNMRSGNYAQALKDFEYVAFSFHDLPMAFRYAAIAAHKLGLTEKARHYAQKEVEIMATPNEFNTYYKRFNIPVPTTVDLDAMSKPFSMPTVDFERFLDARRDNRCGLHSPYADSLASSTSGSTCLTEVRNADI